MWVSHVNQFGHIRGWHKCSLAVHLGNLDQGWQELQKIHKNVPLQVHTLLFIAAMDMSRHFESDERPPWLTDEKFFVF